MARIRKTGLALLTTGVMAASANCNHKCDGEPTSRDDASMRRHANFLKCLRI